MEEDLLFSVFCLGLKPLIVSFKKNILKLNPGVLLDPRPERLDTVEECSEPVRKPQLTAIKTTTTTTSLSTLDNVTNRFGLVSILEILFFCLG